jgi:holo-[acyl-carrier protein] synthase
MSDLDDLKGGVGIDVVSLDKISHLWEAHRYRLRDDILSERELHSLMVNTDGTDRLPEQLSPGQLRYLGTRFAAKEAALKALGAPHRIACNWCDLEVLGSGNVEIELRNEPKQLALRLGIRRLIGSSASTDTTCIAVIVRET